MRSPEGGEGQVGEEVEKGEGEEEGLMPSCADTRAEENS